MGPMIKVVLRIFIALKNPSLSAGFENANLGSNGKHANHYTTEDDYGHIMKQMNNYQLLMEYFVRAFHYRIMVSTITTKLFISHNYME
jgi:hypothetical protein